MAYCQIVFTAWVEIPIRPPTETIESLPDLHCHHHPISASREMAALCRIADHIMFIYTHASMMKADAVPHAPALGTRSLGAQRYFARRKETAQGSSQAQLMSFEPF